MPFRLRDDTKIVVSPVRADFIGQEAEAVIAALLENENCQLLKDAVGKNNFRLIRIRFAKVHIVELLAFRLKPIDRWLVVDAFPMVAISEYTS